MTISVVGSVDVMNSGSSISTLSPHASTAVDDLLVAFFVCYDVGVSLGSGFSEVGRKEPYGAISPTQVIAVKPVSEAGDITSYTFSHTYTGGTSGLGLVTLRGANNKAPVAAHGFRGVNDGTTANVIAPSLLSPAANHMLLTGHTLHVGYSTLTFTPPSGMTEEVDVNDGTLQKYWGLEVCTLAVGAGYTGTKTAVASNVGDSQVGGSLLIAPLPVSGAVPTPGLFAHNF